VTNIKMVLTKQTIMLMELFFERIYLPDQG